MFRRTTIDTELLQVPLFEGLSNRELAAVAQLSTPIEVPAGTVLAEEGASGAEFFIVLEGRVDVVQGAEVVATRGAGAYLGEVALLEQRPRTASLVATTPVRTRVASRREFSGLLTAVPVVSERLTATLADRLGHAA
jgi:CRP-like cAMP-binding protein